MQRIDRRHRRGLTSQVFFGVIVIAVGLGLLLRKAGMPLPHWLFRWEMILILVGIVGGVRNQFRDLGWLIPVIIGCVFLSDDVFPNLNLRGYIWPIGLIVLGVIIAINANRGRRNAPPDEGYIEAENNPAFNLPPFNKQSSANAPNDATLDSNDVLNATSVFGGAKRQIVSKNFLGGEVVAVFGGVEINLSHADIQGPVTIESTNVMGGTKIIVPSDWDVQSEMVAVFGGVEDKRVINPAMINPKKKLRIIGTSFLGGLEIKNY